MAHAQGRRRYPLVVSYAEATKRETVEKHQSDLLELQEMSRLWSAIYFYVEERVSEQDALVPLHECLVESGTSLVAACHGLYRAAEASLRSLLELALSAVLFDIDQSAIDEYERRDRTPPFRVLKRVLDSRRIAVARRKLWRARCRRVSKDLRSSMVDRLYHDELSKSVHAHFDTWSHEMAPEYDRQAFRHWRARFRLVHVISLGVVLCHFTGIVVWMREQQRSDPAWLNLPWDALFGLKHRRLLGLAD